jgi:hypothetical protein
MTDKGKVARPERFELPTLWFEARCSIQLSYGRAVSSSYSSDAGLARAVRAEDDTLRLLAVC